MEVKAGSGWRGEECERRSSSLRGATGRAGWSGFGSGLAQGLTTSLFRPVVYQLQTKGLKVYTPLNKFVTISTCNPSLPLSFFRQGTFDAAVNRKFREDGEFVVPKFIKLTLLVPSWNMNSFQWGNTCSSIRGWRFCTNYCYSYGR